MMKTKGTTRQALLALTALAFLGFGLAACGDTPDGGGWAVSPCALTADIRLRPSMRFYPTCG